ncbi:MAG TPA: STAS domain-containing protein [Jatrophihabitans sp.]|nr:STAS domain-containing protein [Jatrophihabitans sp.]
MTELTVHSSADGDRSTLAVAGELDLGSVAELRQHAEDELASRHIRTLTLDLSELTFIDSSGLGLLVELKRTAATAKVTMEIVNVPAGPARVISIAGLSDTLGVSAGDKDDSPDD